MDNWKTSLDKYLTSSPDDSFDNCCEDVANAFTDEFYEANEDWVTQSSGECNKLMNELFNSGKTPIEAAQIIQEKRILFS